MYKVVPRKFKELMSVAQDSKACELLSSADSYLMVKRPGQNVTVVMSALIGREYNKTFGHYHKPHFAEKYKVLYGEAGILLQKLKDPDNYFGEVSEVLFKKLSAEEEFLIPKGYGHALINIGDMHLITLDDQDDNNFDHSYEPIAQKHGMAYYVVEGEKGVEFVKNPNYHEVSEVVIL